jgi:hypothetical protein
VVGRPCFWLVRIRKVADSDILGANLLFFDADAKEMGRYRDVATQMIRLWIYS